MKKSDIYERGYIKVDFFQHWWLIIKVYAHINNLSVGDLGILCYLHGMPHYTSKDFNEGKHYMSWDKKKHQRLMRQGWVKIRFKRKKRTDHHKYSVTMKTNMVVNKMMKIAVGEECFPENAVKGTRDVDNRLRHSIRVFNKKFNAIN